MFLVLEPTFLYIDLVYFTPVEPPMESKTEESEENWMTLKF